jgi:cytochrome c biogenesis protein CcdA
MLCDKGVKQAGECYNIVPNSFTFKRLKAIRNSLTFSLDRKEVWTAALEGVESGGIHSCSVQIANLPRISIDKKIPLAKYIFVMYIIQNSFSGDFTMPKHLCSILLLLLSVFAFSKAADTPSDKLLLRFFGSRTCGECIAIKESVLKPLTLMFPQQLTIEIYNIEDTAGYLLMTKLEEAYKLKTTSPQELFFPDTVLLGFDAIIATSEKLVKTYLANPAQWKKVTVTTDSTKYSNALSKKVAQFTFWGVTAAGLVDGVNPCAIATLIFLISFLATQKRKRAEILAIGLTFTLTVYCTYLLMGAGAFKAITMLDQYRWLSLAIRWSAVAAAGIVGIISVWDAFAFSRSGKTEDIKLQLPKAVKLQIHKVISANLKGSQLIGGAIITRLPGDTSGGCLYRPGLSAHDRAHDTGRRDAAAGLALPDILQSPVCAAAAGRNGLSLLWNDLEYAGKDNPEKHDPA